MLKEYDMIASLGGNCDVAAQLRLRNLRPASYPLDWCLMDGKTTLEYLPVGLQTRFAELCRKENLVEWHPSPEVDVANMAPYLYRDTLTGWLFIHHFQRSISETGGYEPVADAFRRRIDRFFSRLEKAETVLFVLSVNGPFFELADADALHGRIQGLYRGKHVDLRVMQFNAGADWTDHTRWGGGAFMYARRHNAYDWGGDRQTSTNFEWSFLDNIHLSGQPGVPRGLNRIEWKIWRHLGKSLAKKGFLAPVGHR